MPFTIFPLHGILRDAAGVVRCGCGHANCGSKPGKHPVIAWSKLSPGEQVKGPHGHGLVTGWKSDVFVVDLDSDDASDAFAAMGDAPDTRTVRTARGWHVYFKWPGFPVHTGKDVLGPGIDIRGDGGMVVMPGSPHESGAVYELWDDVPIADAPDWLLADPRIKGRITTEASANAPTPVEPGTELFTYRHELGQKACTEMPPAIEGQGGHDALFRLSLRLVRDLELPLDTCHSLVRDIYNPRCQPAWSDKDIDHKLTQARDKSDIKPGNATDIDLSKFAPSAPADAFAAMLAQVAQGSNPKADPLNLDTQPLDDADLPTEYIVDSILPRGNVGMFVAQPYALKTWAAYSLAIAVSKGEPWLGRHATKQGTVVLVDFEMGRRQLRKRVRMLGGDERVKRAIDPPKLLEPETWAALFDLKPTLIVVDSLSAGNRASEEKDPKFAIPLDYAKKLANACDCSVIFIHHTVKDTAGKSKQAWVRGSGAIFGQLDVCYVFETMPAGDRGEKRASVDCIKMRQGEEPKPFAIQLTDARGVELYEAQGDAGTVTGGNIEDAIRLNIGAKGPASRNDLAARLKRRPKAVSDALADMKSRGEVIEIDRAWHLDGPNIRAARIISTATDESIVPSTISTAAKLAAAAHVKVEDVNRLVTQGRLSRTSEGEFGAWFIPST